MTIFSCVEIHEPITYGLVCCTGYHCYRDIGKVNVDVKFDPNCNNDGSVTPHSIRVSLSISELTVDLEPYLKPLLDSIDGLYSRMIFAVYTRTDDNGLIIDKYRVPRCDFQSRSMIHVFDLKNLYINREVPLCLYITCLIDEGRETPCYTAIAFRDYRRYPTLSLDTLYWCNGDYDRTPDNDEDEP